MRMVNAYLVLAATALTPVLANAQETSPLAKKAKSILQTHCYRCHGENGAVEGGVNYLLSRQQLVTKKKVVPGNLKKSKLYRRILLGEMPPESEKGRPGPEELDAIKKWIEAGAPDFDPPTRRREFLDDQLVWRLIDNDLAKLPEAERRFMRYFTMVHLYNAGLGDDELLTHRQGVSKLVNSLSWGKEVAAPVAIDPAKTVLRIDLRRYQWSERTWNLLVEAYPFGVLRGTPVEKSCQTRTRASLPLLRGDWFVARAALPPLYHDILQLPMTDRALEKLLRVEVAENLKDGLAIRAGFNGSGVSRNNRLIERHESLFGAYWKSYDFAGNTGRQNLFAAPLGPGPGSNTFRHDGGELIFNLPNGLQAYMLVDNKGRRIDKGPVEIVSDPRRPDRTVVNGLSCMSCHARGTIPKEDQIRPHVEKNQQAFVKDELTTILGLYAERDKLQAVLDADSRRFQAAVEKTGCRTGSTEPIAALALRFEAEVDLDMAAGELGLPAASLRKKFAGSVTLGRLLGPLAVEGGTVQRQAFTSAFPAVIRDMEMGTALAGRNRPWTPGSEAAEAWREFARPRHFPTLELGTPIVCKFNPTDVKHLHAVAISPKGARMLASESRVGIVTLWDAAAADKVRAHLVGHRGNVLALDFSPDGKLLASGAIDQTARIWDAATGREIFQLGEHAGFVRAVRFSPDGQLLATGSDCVRLWNASDGKEVLNLGKLPHWVDSLAFSPDSQIVAAAGKTGVHLFNTQSGRLIDRFSLHEGAMLAIAFSPFGNILASGGSDGAIVLWDWRAKKSQASLKGHKEPVHSLVFSQHGNLLLSAGGGDGRNGEVIAWDPKSGDKLATLDGHAAGVSCVAIAANGKKAATCGADATVRVWDLLFLNKTPLDPFEGHALPTAALAMTSDGQLALSGSADRTVRLWQVETGKQLKLLSGHAQGIVSVAIAPGGKLGYSTGPDKTVRKWDLASGKQKKEWTMPGFSSEVVLSGDGKHLAVNVSSSMVRLLDPESGDSRHELPAQVRQLTFSPGSATLAGIEAPSKVRLWQTDSGKQLAHIDVATDSFLNVLVFTPDGKRLIVGNRSGTIILLDLNGKEARRFALPSCEIRAAHVSRDGKRIYACGTESVQEAGGPGKVISQFRVWDTETGKLLGRRTEELLVFRIAVPDNERFILFTSESVLKKSTLPW